MRATILLNGDLELSVSAEERAVLDTVYAEDPEGFDTDRVMYDMMEHLICNSDYYWMLPEWIGALTDAPILGTYSETEPVADRAKFPGRIAGYWDGTCWGDQVVEAWGFMRYETRSLQGELREKGSACLTRLTRWSTTSSTEAAKT